jgi:hypothetical protein
MRLRHRISRSDQYVRQQQNITQQTITTAFSWYQQNRSLPIVDFVTDSTLIFVNGLRTGPPIVRKRVLFAQIGSSTSVVESPTAQQPYPIPAVSGGLLWLPEGGSGRHVLYDVLGNVVCEWMEPGASLVLPLVPPGLYLLEIGPARYVPIPVAPYR